MAVSSGDPFREVLERGHSAGTEALTVPHPYPYGAESGPESGPRLRAAWGAQGRVRCPPGLGSHAAPKLL